MTETAWHKLEGIDPATATFPARARYEGEGIIIFRTKAGLRGVERTCPHAAATLIDAVLMAGETALRCANHAYVFKLADGKGMNCPGYRLKVYEVKAEDGALFARAVD